MKKFLMLILAAASISSAAPAWTGAVHIKEIWVVPGSTPVIRVKTDETTGNPYYGFYLNPTGNANLLQIAQDAISGNLLMKIYADKSSSAYFSTGLSSPNVSSVSSVYPLYTMSIDR